jgi:hypothetical protein
VIVDEGAETVLREGDVMVQIRVFSCLPTKYLQYVCLLSGAGTQYAPRRAAAVSTAGS